jgi:hypothetical protein
MIDIDLLKSLGVTQKALKAAFTAEEKAPKIKAFCERASDRIKEAIDSNVTGYQANLAIDRAIDSPMFAKSRTMFKGLIQGKHSTKDVLSLVKEWGIGDWMKNVCGCGNSCTNVATCPTQMQKLDIPAFFEVDFPIALAMLNIRSARIFNDRNLFPQFKYEPLVSTPEHRLKCEIITYRVQVQAQQMELKAVLKQVIRQGLTYSTCLMLPREAWWADQQPTSEVTPAKKKKDKPKRKMRTVKEGLRYEHPHPSRMYYDLAHPAYTLNSDTGCQYSGYWGLVRYGDVKDNPDYWQTDKITFGKDSFRITDTNRMFFSTVMPCVMKFPVCADPAQTDRQEKMQAYTTNERDCAVLLTNHFERLNPERDLGLKNKAGDGYDGDVWFRFVVASDDTIVYAEPLAYNPNLIFLYDPDANKARVTSLVQECIPTQDMVGNLISQAILTAKNNLRQINFVNTDVLDQSVIDRLANLGEKSYREPQLVPFSLHESTRVDNDRRDAIIPVQFPRMSIAELVNLVDKCLDILSRQLVMSAQELGASDSHEVTAQEVLQKASSTSTRLNYTASGVDDFIYAWQRQLHDAGIAYWDDEVFAEVALQGETDKKALEKLGFEIETENEQEKKVGVRGSKDKLELDMFTARRDAADRVNSVAMATAMTNFFQAFINNPMAIQIVGVDQFVQLVNGILESFQFRKDWRLTAKLDVFAEQKKMAERDRADAKQMAEQQQGGAVAEQLNQITQKIIADIGMQLKPVFEQAATLDAQQQKSIEELQAATSQMALVLKASMQPPVPAPMPMAPAGGMMV